MAKYMLKFLKLFFRSHSIINVSKSIPSFYSNLESPVTILSTPDEPISFGCKCIWLAIKSEDPLAVIHAFNLTDVQESNWKSGIEAAYERNKLFVTPSISGWVLVVGITLPEAEDKPHFMEFLNIISAQFDEVQYFLTHRIVEFHVWARIMNGDIARIFAYLGESNKILFDIGESCTNEKALAINIPSDDVEDDAELEKAVLPNEDHVMQMAGVWSINPLEIDRMGLLKSTGFVCSNIWYIGINNRS